MNKGVTQPAAEITKKITKSTKKQIQPKVSQPRRLRRLILLEALPRPMFTRNEMVISILPSTIPVETADNEALEEPENKKARHERTTEAKTKDNHPSTESEEEQSHKKSRRILKRVPSTPKRRSF